MDLTEQEASQNPSQGEEPAPIGSQGGAKRADGQQAPKTPASSQSGGGPSIEELLEQTHKSSLAKGAQKALKDLERKWGISIDEVETILSKRSTPSPTQPSQGQSGQQKDEGVDYRAAFTELRPKYADLETKYSKLEAEAAKLWTRAEAAKSAKIKAFYMQAGAIPDFVDDLVKLTDESYEWTDDGDLEIVERANGSITPSRLSIESFVKKIAKEKSIYFKALARSGSGSDSGSGRSDEKPTERQTGFSALEKLRRNQQVRK